MAPSKPLNNPLVSNEATASTVGPDDQKLCSFDGSSLVGTSTAANNINALFLNITPGRRIDFSEGGGVVRPLVGPIRATVVAHFLLLPAACLVAVLGGLVE